MLHLMTRHNTNIINASKLVTLSAIYYCSNIDIVNGKYAR